MNKRQVTALLILGIGLLAGSVLLRVFSGGKHEIKSVDLIFIVLPLLLVALATGRLKGLDWFGIRADLSDLWAEAAATDIEHQIGLGEVMEIMDIAAKGGLANIPHLIEQRVQALSFRLGSGGYTASAVKEYFDALHGSSPLRYIVINHLNGSFFGMCDAPDLIAWLRSRDDGYRRFTDLLNRGDDQARVDLTFLPGFVPADHAVTDDVSKRDALRAMEEYDRDALPVIDYSGYFVGTVERTRLTAAMMLEVTEKLGASRP